jgi:hypothetical protein
MNRRNERDSVRARRVAALRHIVLNILGLLAWVLGPALAGMLLLFCLLD